MEPFLAVVLFGEGGFAVAVQLLLINPFFVLGIWLRSPQSSSKNTSDLSLSCRDVPVYGCCIQGRAEPIPTPAAPSLGASPFPDYWCEHNPSKPARLVLPNAFCQHFACLPKPPRFLMGMQLKNCAIGGWYLGTVQLCGAPAESSFHHDLGSSTALRGGRCQTHRGVTGLGNSPSARAVSALVA